jgi:hypothetical protein
VRPKSKASSSSAEPSRRATLYTFAYTNLDDLLGTDRDLALAISNAMLKTLASRLRATNDKVTAMFAMASFG